MAKVLTKEQADKLLPEHERQLAAIEQRENEALSELEKLGFRVTLHTLPRYSEEDVLVGTKARWVNGDCYAVLYDRSGKRKHVSGISAVDALTQAQVWWRWQEGLKEYAPNKFHPTRDDVPENRVVQRAAGDTAETKARRENGVRRIVSFQSGTPEIVDGHGTPLVAENDARASQYSPRD